MVHIRFFLLKNGKHSATQTDSLYKSYESRCWGIDTPLGGREGGKEGAERERKNRNGKMTGRSESGGGGGGGGGVGGARSKAICNLPWHALNVGEWVSEWVRWLPNVFIPKGQSLHFCDRVACSVKKGVWNLLCQRCGKIHASFWHKYFWSKL